MDDMFSKLSLMEAEINASRRRIMELEEKVTDIKKDNQRLLGELQRTRAVCFMEKCLISANYIKICKSNHSDKKN